MNGRAHTLGGMAAFLATSAVADHWYHYHQSPLHIAVGTVMSGGAALLADADLEGRVTSNEGGATVARAFGVPGLFVAECVEKISLAVRNTVRLKRDKKTNSGHRTLLHTAPVAGLSSYGAVELCTHQPRWGTVALLYVTFALAYRGLFPGSARRAGWLLTNALAALAALAVYLKLPTSQGLSLISAAVGVGWGSHIVVDMLTSHGCPVLWPLPIFGRMWRNLRIPLISCDAGSRVEKYLWSPAFIVAGAVSVFALVFPVQTAHAWTAPH